MFGDKYKKDMDKIKAPESAVSRIAEGMKAHGKKRKVNFKRIIALAAACIIAVAGIAITVPNAENIGNGISVLLNGAGIFDIFTGEEGAPQGTDGYATYNQLCAAITDRVNTYKEQNRYLDWEGVVNEGVVGNTMDVPTADEYKGEDVLESAPEAAPDREETEDFSDTNNQVSGVQEADVIKTDGRFIYTVKKNMLSVFSVSQGEISRTERITLEHECRDMMLVGNRLVIVSKDINDTPYYTDTDWNTVTKVYVYEIDESGKASLADEFVQSGYYVSSRMVDGKLILVTNHCPEYNRYLHDKDYEVTRDEVMNDLPQANEKYLEPECIVVPEDIVSVSFLVVSSFDARSGESESAAIMGAGSDVYADTDTLYVYCLKYKEDGYHTLINRFYTKNGSVYHTGSALLKGRFNNQYSFDEYKGNLRVALTRSKDNVLYVLDESLEIIGEIGGMGINESIKSVRFSGDLAYVVTFRQTDPLYAIDISDPANPVILSELKIPGFSTYMQSYGEGKMFGFGNDADIETGRTQGIKLSMFDTTDPDDVKEEATLLLGETTYFADNVLKAVSVHYDKGIIMFPYVDHSNVDDGKFVAQHVFALYTYTDENGFELLGKDAIDYDDNVSNIRGIYIGDYIYVITLYYDGAVTVRSYTMDNLTPVDVCAEEK